MSNQPPTRDAELKRQRREQLKELKICIDCGSQRTAPGRTRCEWCRERLRAAWDRHKQKQQGNTFCGEAVLVEPNNQFDESVNHV